MRQDYDTYSDIDKADYDRGFNRGYMQDGFLVNDPEFNQALLNECLPGKPRVPFVQGFLDGMSEKEKLVYSKLDLERETKRKWNDYEPDI